MANKTALAIIDFWIDTAARLKMMQSAKKFWHVRDVLAGLRKNQADIQLAIDYMAETKNSDDKEILLAELERIKNA